VCNFLFGSVKGNELCKNGRVMKGLLFTCYHGNHNAQSIIYEGLSVRPTAFNYLGKDNCSPAKLISLRHLSSTYVIYFLWHYKSHLSPVSESQAILSGMQHLSFGTNYLVLFTFLISQIHHTTSCSCPEPVVHLSDSILKLIFSLDSCLCLP